MWYEKYWYESGFFYSLTISFTWMNSNKWHRCVAYTFDFFLTLFCILTTETLFQFWYWDEALQSTKITELSLLHKNINFKGLSSVSEYEQIVHGYYFTFNAILKIYATDINIEHDSNLFEQNVRVMFVEVIFFSICLTECWKHFTLNRLQLEHIH